MQIGTDYWRAPMPLESAEAKHCRLVHFDVIARFRLLDSFLLMTKTLVRRFVFPAFTFVGICQIGTAFPEDVFFRTTRLQFRCSVAFLH